MSNMYNMHLHRKNYKGNLLTKRDTNVILDLTVSSELANLDLVFLRSFINNLILRKNKLLVYSNLEI